MNIPEKWCIRLKDRKTEEIVGKWFNDNIKIDCTYHSGWAGWFLHYPKYKSGTCTALTPEPGYTEITFKQFEKYILNKETPVEEQSYNYLIPILKKLNIQ